MSISIARQVGLAALSRPRQPAKLTSVLKRVAWLCGFLWAACEGGPISDFPFSGRDSDDDNFGGSGGFGPDGESTGGTPSNDGQGGAADPTGAGSQDSGALGQDAAVPEASACDPRPPPSDAGAAAGDADAETGEDASAPDPDGGVPMGSDAGDAGSTTQAEPTCAGALCTWSRTEWAALAEGVCAQEDSDLIAACSGALQRSAMECAADLMTAGTPDAESVAGCMDPEATEPSACGFCYAEAAACAVEHCAWTGSWTVDDAPALWECAERECGVRLRDCIGASSGAEADVGAEADAGAADAG